MNTRAIRLPAGRIAAPSALLLDGEHVSTKLGGYANAQALEADIRRFAL